MSPTPIPNEAVGKPFQRADFMSVWQVVRQFNLLPAADNEIEAAQQLATDLIGAKLTPASDLQALQRHFPASVLVYREDGIVTGVFAFMMLRPEAIAAVWEERLDPLELNLDLCCRQGDPIGGGYSLGFAGTTKAAGHAVVAGSCEIARRILPDVPTFTRAVSDVGRHIVVDKLGYQRIAPQSDIYWIAPGGFREAAA